LSGRTERFQVIAASWVAAAGNDQPRQSGEAAEKFGQPS
jgi:hypothetical protein